MDKFIQRRPRSTSEVASSPSKRSRLSDIQDELDSDSNASTNIKVEEDNSTVVFTTDEPPDSGIETTISIDLDDIKTEEGQFKKPRWIRGQSSLYTDAFNLALDIVLQYESHLFDEKEMAVFKEWRKLNYQEQYLYVRLFLRKAAAWHRISSLPYEGDVPDPFGTCTLLQTKRTFKVDGDTSRLDLQEEIPDLPVPLTESNYGDKFTFADSSISGITTSAEAVSLLSLDELKTLGKELRIPGKTKSELAENIVRAAEEQTGLLSMGITSSRRSSFVSVSRKLSDSLSDSPSRQAILVEKILAITGLCIRLTPITFRLFERVHLVFHRSTLWSERSLTAIILAKISKRNFPSYTVHRSANIFPSRILLLEYEAALRLEAEVDLLLEQGTEGFPRLLDILGEIYPRWKAVIKEENGKHWMFETGEGLYLRRFSPAHTYTRLVHKGAYVLGRVKEYKREHRLLCELLDQRLFHPARRGAWYQRKALLEEHYMYPLLHEDLPKLKSSSDAARRHWRQVAANTCEIALQDNDCHVIFHYDLQKRLVKLERQLKLPKRLQHDFGHVLLKKAGEDTVEGIQIKTPTNSRKTPLGRASTRTLWLDEYAAPQTLKISDKEAKESSPELPINVTVEEMCLSYYKSPTGGSWCGYHAEGGIIRTLFAYLFFDILFLPVPNVFQTPYQSCPLDLFTDAFYPTRVSEINRRLAEISNGAAAVIIRNVHAREHDRQTAVLGLDWSFSIEDLSSLARCFPPSGLAGVCRVMAEDYRVRGGGLPDLVLWREIKAGTGECRFVEVKSANDRVSDTQRLWMHVLAVEGVDVVVCRAVAKEVREL